MTIAIADLNFDDADQIQQFMAVLAAYSQEDGAGNQSIEDSAQRDLPQKLREHPTCVVIVAIIDNQTVGVAVCFGGFSTFKAKPVLNVHDLAVLPSHRGKGVGTALLDAATERARELGCCKLTLEVIQSNTRAHQLYNRKGFVDPTNEGPSLFLEKPLND